MKLKLLGGRVIWQKRHAKSLLIKIFFFFLLAIFNFVCKQHDTCAVYTQLLPAECRASVTVCACTGFTSSMPAQWLKRRNVGPGRNGKEGGSRGKEQ